MGTGQELTMIDLFCGAGGLSLGLVRAGFTPLVAVDHNQSALQTYTHNLGSHAIQLDLSTSVNLPEAAVIVGGPPCQGFSSAGLRHQNDRRNSLYDVLPKRSQRNGPWPLFLKTSKVF